MCSEMKFYRIIEQKNIGSHLFIICKVSSLQILLNCKLQKLGLRLMLGLAYLICILCNCWREKLHTLNKIKNGIIEEKNGNSKIKNVMSTRAEPAMRKLCIDTIKLEDTVLN